MADEVGKYLRRFISNDIINIIISMKEPKIRKDKSVVHDFTELIEEDEKYEVIRFLNPANTQIFNQNLKELGIDSSKFQIGDIVKFSAGNTVELVYDEENYEIESGEYILNYLILEGEEEGEEDSIIYQSFMGREQIVPDSKGVIKIMQYNKNKDFFYDSVDPEFLFMSYLPIPDDVTDIILPQIEDDLKSKESVGIVITRDSYSGITIFGWADRNTGIPYSTLEENLDDRSIESRIEKLEDSEYIDKKYYSVLSPYIKSPTTKIEDDDISKKKNKLRLYYRQMIHKSDKKLDYLESYIMVYVQWGNVNNPPYWI